MKVTNFKRRINIIKIIIFIIFIGLASCSGDQTPGNKWWDGKNTSGSCLIDNNSDGIIDVCWSFTAYQGNLALDCTAGVGSNNPGMYNTSCSQGMTSVGGVCDINADTSITYASSSYTMVTAAADCSTYPGNPVWTISPYCGDGIINGSDVCDNGASNSDTVPDACRTTCVWAACGDGTPDTGEACDDGNLVSGDGCSATCTSEGEIVSTVVSAPTTTLVLDTPLIYTMANSSYAYWSLPVIADGTKVYGIYLTGATANITSMGVGYYDTNWGAFMQMSNYIAYNNPGTFDYNIAFNPVNQTLAYLLRINGVAAGDTFTLTLREAARGSLVFGNFVAIPIGTTPTWIGIDTNLYTYFQFVVPAMQTSVTISLTNLTSGVDLEVMDATANSLIPQQLFTGLPSELTKTVQVTNLTSGVTYVLRITRASGFTGYAAVGAVTIVSP